MKKTYLCLKTYCSKEYGVDFLCGKTYDYENGYMHSVENGTSVMIEEDELKENWKIIDQ